MRQGKFSKVLTIFLAFVLICTNSLICFADEEVAASNEEWIAPSLKENHNPYLSGSYGKIRPTENLTRGEFCAIFYTLFDLYDNGNSKTFSDVTPDMWYSQSISEMVSTGIINGYPDGSFRPDNPLTRAEFAYIISNVYGASEKDSPFYDAQDHWAKNQIVYASERGWVTGYEDGSFRPDNTITRAEAIVVFNRILNRSAASSKEMLVNNNVCPFYDVKVTDWFYADVMEATVSHEHTGEGSGEVWQSFEHLKSGYEPGLLIIDASKGTYLDTNGQFCHFAPYSVAIINDKNYLTTGDGFIDLAHFGIAEVNGSLYCFNSDATLLVGGMYGNLYFGNDGKYTCGDATLDGLVDAALAKCTNDTMTQADKLRASYLYLRDNTKYLSRPHHARGNTDFVIEDATFMFNNMKGNCYCYAAAFLLMARRLGYSDSYVVSGGLGSKNSDHAWVMINGKMFDPELEYAYLYRFSYSTYYNLYNMTVGKTPFIYHFPY